MFDVITPKGGRTFDYGLTNKKLLLKRIIIMNKKALVLLAPGFEEIEAVTAIDILRRAEIEVIVCAVSTEKLVKASRGTKIEADILFDNFKGEVDCVVLPGGGGGAENLAASSKVITLLERTEKAGKLIAAICAAPAHVLVPAGIIGGREITCYPEFKDNIEVQGIYRDKPVVISGNLITSQGVGTAIDFALAIVECLEGPDKATAIKKAILYNH